MGRNQLDATGSPLAEPGGAEPGGAGHLGGTPDGIEGLVQSIQAEESPISMAPFAGALPLTPEGESRNEGVFHDD